MNIIEYKIEKIKNYELEIWQSGICKSLAKINLDGDTVLYDCSGLCNIKDYIKVPRNSSITDGIFACLSAIRKIVEGIAKANDYLIDESSISLDVDKIWFDRNLGCVLLLPQYSEGDLITRICALCQLLGAEDIAYRIEERNSESALSYRELLRFLSSWELELR